MGRGKFGFCFISILPGDPSRMMMGQRENEEIRLAIQQKYGFDQPIHKQYLYYLNDLSPISLHSNNTNDFTNTKNHMYNIFASFTISKSSLLIKAPYLRSSFVRKDMSVASIISDTLPNTFILAFSAIFIALFFGLLLGVYSAIQQYKFVDQLLSVISVLGMALPSFFSAIIIAWLFGFLWV